MKELLGSPSYPRSPHLGAGFVVPVTLPTQPTDRRCARKQSQSTLTPETRPLDELDSMSIGGAITATLSRSRDDARVFRDELLDTMFWTCTLLLHTSATDPG